MRLSVIWKGILPLSHGKYHRIWTFDVNRSWRHLASHRCRPYLNMLILRKLLPQKVMWYDESHLIAGEHPHFPLKLVRKCVKLLNFNEKLGKKFSWKCIWYFGIIFWLALMNRNTGNSESCRKCLILLCFHPYKKKIHHWNNLSGSTSELPLLGGTRKYGGRWKWQIGNRVTPTCLNPRRSS